MLLRTRGDVKVAVVGHVVSVGVRREVLGFLQADLDAVALDLDVVAEFLLKHRRGAAQIVVSRPVTRYQRHSEHVTLASVCTHEATGLTLSARAISSFEAFGSMPRF